MTSREEQQAERQAVREAKDSLIHAAEALTLPTHENKASAWIWALHAALKITESDQSGQALELVQRALAKEKRR